MGRTIPSYRLALGQEYDEWKPFIKSLDKKDQKLFREMLLLPSFHISACMMAVKPFVIHPAFMSMLFQHYKQLNDISKRLGALEKREQAANN